MIAWLLSILTPQVIAGIVSLAVVGGTWWFKSRTRQRRHDTIRSEIEKINNPKIDYIDPRLLSPADSQHTEAERIEARDSILADIRDENPNDD